MTLSKKWDWASPKIFLAPMEGVVDPIVRKLWTQLGGIDFCTTEFVRITQQVLPAKVFYRYAPELLENQGRTTSNTPVFVQLLGSDPHCLQENALAALEAGAFGIDLNFGCPAKRVNQHDGGANLLKTPERIFKITQAVSRALPEDVPFSIKIRLGYDHKDFIFDLAHAAEDGGAQALTVHGRTKVEGYRPPAHWEPIAKIRESISIPVIANGDIWTPEDYQRCRQVTGCPHVMMGRGLMARPSLALEAKGLRASPLSWTEMTSLLLELTNLSLKEKGERYALSRGKQMLKLFSQSQPQAKLTFDHAKRSQDLVTFQTALKDSEISVSHLDKLSLRAHIESNRIQPQNF